MKKLLFVLGVSVSFLSCNTDKDETPGNYRRSMRDFVISISEYAKANQAGFVIIPQNGIELISETGNEDGALATDYLNAIDAHGQESLFFGYNNDDEPTPSNETEWLQSFLDRSIDEGNTILVTDYCSTPSNMTNSYTQNETAGYISFAADERNLNNIPTFPNPIRNENANSVTSLSEVENFVYLINPENYNTKVDFIAAVAATNYDLILIDLFFNDGTEFTSSEVNQLRTKSNGGSRLVVCYMSIGEAENYRYYWQSSWLQNPPSFLKEENPDWEGNYKVEYWNSNWQQLIFGSETAYLDKVLSAGFDGVYLDIIDAYEYFEEQ